MFARPKKTVKPGLSNQAAVKLGNVSKVVAIPRPTKMNTSPKVPLHSMQNSNRGDTWETMLGVTKFKIKTL